MSLTISDWISKGNCTYWLSRIDFEKVLVTDHFGLNSEKYLLLTISDWIPKGPVTDYLGLRFKSYLWLTISDLISKGVPVIDYNGLKSKRYLWLTTSDWIQKVPVTDYLGPRIEFQKASVTEYLCKWELLKRVYY